MRAALLLLSLASSSCWFAGFGGESCHTHQGRICDEKRFTACNFSAVRCQLDGVATESLSIRGDSVLRVESDLREGETVLIVNVLDSEQTSVDPSAVRVAIDGVAAERIEPSRFRIPAGSLRRIRVDISLVPGTTTQWRSVQVHFVQPKDTCELCTN